MSKKLTIKQELNELEEACEKLEESRVIIREEIESKKHKLRKVSDEVKIKKGSMANLKRKYACYFSEDETEKKISELKVELIEVKKQNVKVRRNFAVFLKSHKTPHKEIAEYLSLSPSYVQAFVENTLRRFRHPSCREEYYGKETNN